MTWSSRVISPEERADLLGRFGTYPARSRQGVVSAIAHYGTYVVLIPMVGGGLLGRLLALLGLPENSAFLAGLTLATIASAIIFRHRSRVEQRARADWERRREAIEAIDVLPTYTFEVARIWAIESEPDWPAYLLRDSQGRFVLLCSDVLQFAEPDFAHRNLEVTLAPPDRQHILELRWTGRNIPLETGELSMPHDEWPGDGDFTEVPAHAIPDQWRAAVGAV